MSSDSNKKMKNVDEFEIESTMAGGNSEKLDLVSIDTENSSEKQNENPEGCSANSFNNSGIAMEDSKTLDTVLEGET